MTLLKHGASHITSYSSLHGLQPRSPWSVPWRRRHLPPAHPGSSLSLQSILTALYCPDLPRTPLPGTLAWSSAVCPLVSCRLCLQWRALLPPPPQRGPCSPLGYSLPQSALIPSPAVLSLSELSSAERLPCVYWFIISLPKLPHKVEVSCFPTTPLGLE